MADPHDPRNPMTARDGLAVSRYARVAGVAMLLSVVFGMLGEMIRGIDPERVRA